MRISSAFPSRYLKAADLDGHKITVVMSHVNMEDVSGSGDLQPVLYFEGKDKGMALNKTNSNTIAAIYGDETENWAGQSIILYEAMVDFKGQTVPAIRIRMAPKIAAVKSQPKQKSAAEVIDDDIPF